jgi:jasmonate ZIM domain-containing protein
MVLASRGSLPSAPSTVARSPDANLFASRGSLPSAPSTVARSPDANLFTSRGSLPSAPTTVTRSPDANLFASRGSLPSAPSTVTRSPEANLFAPAKVTAAEVSPAKQMLPQMQQRVSPPKPISSVSQAPCLPKSASSSNIDSTVPKSVMPLRSQPPSTHPVTLAATTAEAIMPRAVPQARKASLARFLEKRKERVTTVAPYSSGKSPIESNDTVGSSIENSKSSLTGITISSNREKSVWRPRNISFSGECPSTNLHI